jgi:hypothetical protein
MKKISKSRGTVWTPAFDEDPEIFFEIAPLTPVLTERINNDFMTSKLVQRQDGKNEISTEFKSLGVVREEAKAVTKGWKGFVYGDDMGPLAGQPVPCNDKTITQLYDEWDDNGAYAAFVVKHANKFSELKEKSLGNSESPSATS